MIETIERINGDLDEKELADFRAQLRIKHDREQRLTQAQQYFTEFSEKLKSVRCAFGIKVIPTQQSENPLVLMFSPQLQFIALE